MTGRTYLVVADFHTSDAERRFQVSEAKQRSLRTARHELNTYQQQSHQLHFGLPSTADAIK